MYNYTGPDEIVSITERKEFIPTVFMGLWSEPPTEKYFTSKGDAKKFIKRMVEKFELKRYKGFWGNPKNGVALMVNF